MDTVPLIPARAVGIAVAIPIVIALALILVSSGNTGGWSPVP